MSGPKHTERILLVDDTPANIDVLNEILSDYKRSIALNGQQAIKIAQSEKKPDLILLDIMMPGMDGYETCEKLKGHPDTFDIPVIFTTALSDLKDKIKGFELGAVDYITKPFEPDELLKRVETHLTILRLRNDLRKWNTTLEQKVVERTIELEESNKRLKEAKEAAEKSDQLKSEFIAQMSHEIGTPLNSLLLSAEMVKQEFEDKMNEDTEELFNTIESTGKRIFRTVQLIMNMSQLRSNSYELTPLMVDMDELCRETINMHKKFADEKNLTLNYMNSSQNYDIRVDRYSVNQVLSNLLDNSIKYTESGKVEVILSDLDNDRLLLAVKDTGIGIAEEYKDKMFELFTQEQQGYVRKYDGNGLGLPVVKGFCDLNKFVLDYDSSKNEGTTFRITIPKRPDRN